MRSSAFDMASGVIEVLYFVPDRRKAAIWYSDVLEAEISRMDDPEHFFIRVGDQAIWLHQADEKGKSGVAGQVAYWGVDDLDASVTKAIELGGSLYRGPLKRLDGKFMCQVKDPFGNVIGLIGSRTH